MKIIDVHSHVLPPRFWRALEREGHWHGATIVSRPNGQQYINTRSRLAGPIEERWRYDAAERVQFMDRHGVDVHLLSAAPYLTNYELEPAEGLASSREVNEDIAALARANPQRFVGLATVPLQDPPAAAAELEWAMLELGLKGAEVCTNVVGLNLDEPQFRPFFAAAERLGAFLFFHPHTPAAADRTGSYYLGNLIGNPLDSTIGIACLIFGGVLDRYPGLKLCFAHGGGYACFGIGRMDHGVKVRPEPQVNHPKHAPSDYLARLYYDCLTHSGEALKYLVDRVGADRVMLGSDFPFDMGYGSPAQWVKDLVCLNAFEKRRILGENAQEVLGIT
jgi:aminocarboxymuconate-semialdehyde decarboxylase